MPQRIEINQGDGTMTSLQSSWTPTPGRELEDFEWEKLSRLSEFSAALGR